MSDRYFQYQGKWYNVLMDPAYDAPTFKDYIECEKPEGKHKDDTYRAQRIIDSVKDLKIRARARELMQKRTVTVDDKKIEDEKELVKILHRVEIEDVTKEVSSENSSYAELEQWTNKDLKMELVEKEIAFSSKANKEQLINLLGYKKE